jgi:hypothetical protein
MKVKKVVKVSVRFTKKEIECIERALSFAAKNVGTEDAKKEYEILEKEFGNLRDI